MQRHSPRTHALDIEIEMMRTGAIRPEFECYGHHPRQRLDNTVTSKQLEKHRESVKAQISWATLHAGDEELLNLLRIESHRLFLMIKAMSRSPG
jgi:hypothetical protein